VVITFRLGEELTVALENAGDLCGVRVYKKGEKEPLVVAQATNQEVREAEFAFQCVYAAMDGDDE
jgi:hypothetical protein